jgi:hypothetical protein
LDFHVEQNFLKYRMKTICNAAPVLAEPMGRAQSSAEIRMQRQGEARESNDTKLKRSVEQVASEPRGGVAIPLKP